MEYLADTVRVKGRPLIFTINEPLSSGIYESFLSIHVDNKIVRSQLIVLFLHVTHLVIINL